MKHILHKFRPTETIDAVIRLYGRHSYTQYELKKLRHAFDELNGKIVPRAGQAFKIPILEAVDDYGNVIDVWQESYSSATPE